jgi:hypothetical protein
VLVLVLLVALRAAAAALVACLVVIACLMVAEQLASLHAQVMHAQPLLRSHLAAARLLVVRRCAPQVALALPGFRAACPARAPLLHVPAQACVLALLLAQPCQ